MKKLKIVIGTWAFGGAYGKYEKEKAAIILKECYDSGFKEFDTAAAYGNGSVESLLGELFGDKKDVLINTKFGNMHIKKKSFEIDDLRQCFEESLKNLKRKSVNILFLHNPRDEIKNYEPIFKLFDELKKERKIKYSGISLARRYDYASKVDLNRFDVIQDDASLLALDFLKLKLNNAKFMARSPLASGILMGNLNKDSAFSDGDHRKEWLKGERLVSIIKRVEILKKISEKNKTNLPSLARNFVLSNDKIDKVIFGLKDISQLKELLQELDKPALDKKIENELISLFEKDFGLINEKHLAY